MPLGQDALTIEGCEIDPTRLLEIVDPENVHLARRYTESGCMVMVSVGISTEVRRANLCMRLHQ
jgi:hypothetical protein